MEEIRILRAACMLGTFTASELTEHSGANPMTVRSVIKRRESFFKKVRKTKTGERGGQPNQYRVDIDKVQEFMRTQTERQAPSGKAPKQIDAVYELLLWRTSATSTPPEERRDMLDAARLTLVQLKQTASIDQASFDEHRRAIESLIALAELEESANAYALVDSASYQDVRSRLLEAITGLRRTNEHMVASALGQRAFGSVLIDTLLKRCEWLEQNSWHEAPFEQRNWHEVVREQENWKDAARGQESWNVTPLYGLYDFSLLQDVAQIALRRLPNVP